MRKWITRLWNRITHRTRLEKILIGIGLVVVILLAIVVVPRFVGCSSGLTGTDGQCVGVTDGSDGEAFGSTPADVLSRIGDENRQVTASGRPFVSVAYLLPIPKPDSTDLSAFALRHELVGAYLTQRQANAAAGDQPLVRLLVANTGANAEHADDVVPALVRMATDTFSDDRLTSVIISGKSRTAAGRAIDALLAADVPVITSRLTADQLTAAQATADKPLARVAPSNSDQTAAAAAYLRSMPTVRRAVIVQNSDADDLYAANLGAQFHRAYPDGTHTILQPTESYSARFGSVANTMKGILRDICQQRPDVVFFAGRAGELGALVSALPTRPCPDTRIRIVTGSDAVDFVTAVAQGDANLRAGLAPQVNAEVDYTALAHPSAWRRSPGSFNAASVALLTGPCPGGTCLPALFPGENLDDGGVILGHDTLLTAVTAVRSPNGINDNPGLVAQELKRIHGEDSVPGASGWISFAPTGEAVDKATPVLQVLPDGTLKFLELSAPRSTPCVPDGKLC